MFYIIGMYRLPIFPRVLVAAGAALAPGAGGLAGADFLAGSALAGTFAAATAGGLATVCLAVCALETIGFNVADFSSVPTGTLTRIVNVFV